MKSANGSIAAMTACVVAAGVWLPSAVDAAQFQTGGTITFTGAIVAPSYGISTHVSGSYQGFHTEKTGGENASTVDVTFAPALNTSLAAHVSLRVNTDAGVVTPQTLKTRFTDNAKHVAQSADAAYSVGRAGGTLSIVGGAQTERAVTVLVSYD